MFCTRRPRSNVGGLVFISGNVVWMCLLFGTTGLSAAKVPTHLQAETVLRPPLCANTR
jgi:hypothetical protein